MPFCIYKRQALPSRKSRFTKLDTTDKIPNAIQQHVTELLQQGASYPIGWHLPVADLLQRLSFDPSSHSLIIDMKPASSEVSVYQLTDIWGFTEWPTFTPLGLRLQSLYVDHKNDDPGKFKSEFSDDHEKCYEEVVREFLYLRVGKGGKKWVWGRTGFVNAALLSPAAWNHLVGVMS
jgi:hypothetical protein